MVTAIDGVSLLDNTSSVYNEYGYLDFMGDGCGDTDGPWDGNSFSPYPTGVSPIG